MEKINIAEILKDCPKGTKLYSPLCGECEFDHIEYMGKIVCQTKKDTTVWFLPTGTYFEGFVDSECMLFPSKENRDWSKFQRLPKDGDIVTYKLRGSLVAFIYKERISTMLVKFHFALYAQDMGFLVDGNIALKENEIVFATEEEKQKLFKAIKDNGYKWNAETKTLEKLIVPKFKVGDRIETLGYRYTIKEITDDYYLTLCGNKIRIDNQDKFTLVPNKFDIATLKPFDKVLVRYGDNYWHVQFFEKYDKRLSRPFVCMNSSKYKQCIPYETNEYLLGTTQDCDQYYRTW